MDVAPLLLLAMSMFWIARKEVSLADIIINKVRDTCNVHVRTAISLCSPTAKHKAQLMICHLLFIRTLF